MDVARTTNASQFANVAGSAHPPVDAAAQRALARAVKTLNSARYFGQDRELVFSFDRESHRAIVRLIDSETKDVIRQIPSEYVLQIAREIDRQVRGESGDSVR